MKRDVRRLAIPAYWLGAIVLVASLAWAAVNRRFDLVPQVGLAIAVVGFAAGVLLDPERVRQALTGRQARYGSNALVMSLAVLGILVVVNYLAYTNPARVDLTEDRQYTLSPETLLMLSRLQEPAVIKGFYTPDMRTEQEDIRPLLDEYRVRSDGKLSYEFINPWEDPVEARNLGVTSDGSMVVLYGDASQVIAYPSEQEITTALIRLSNPGERKVYFLTGHGERDSQDTGDQGYSQLQEILVSKKYDVGVLNLMTEGQVPDDASAVIIAGPQAPLSSSEVEALTAYLDGGGAMILVQEPGSGTDAGTQTDPLGSYLSESWGITLDNDLVIEPNSNYPLIAIAFGYGDHPITARLGTMASIFPSARSISLVQSEGEATVRAGLVYTSSDAWGETDLSFYEAGTTPENQEGVDFKGPLVVAAAAEDTAREARIVVFGDADFATNTFIAQYGNSDILVNSVDWASGQEGLINLTPHAATQRYVVPPSVQATGLIMLTTVVLMPGSVVVLGVYVWWQRRRRV